MTYKQFARYIIMLMMLMLLISVIVSAGTPNQPVLTITCPGDIDQDLAAGECQKFLTISLPVVLTSSPIISLTNDYTDTGDASGIYNVGKTIVTWTATNSDGETVTCSMNVIVNDPFAPTITCTDEEVVAGEAVSFPVVAVECDGYALYFDGTGAPLTLDKDLNLVNQFTYEFYVRPSSTHGIDTELNDDPFEGLDGQKYAIYPGYGGGVYGLGHSEIGVSVGTNGISIYEHSDGYLAAVLVYTASIAADSFTHVAVSINSNGITAKCTLYINGVVVRTVNYTPFPVTHASLGYRPEVAEGGIGGGYFGHFIGAIDDVRVWNYVRTAADMAPGLQIELTGNEPGLAAYLNFNEGSGVRARGPMGTALFSSDMVGRWIQPSAMRGFTLTNDITGDSSAPVFQTAGTKIITWTATDPYGNSTTCTATVVVKPAISIICPADIIVETAPGVCGAYVNVPLPIVDYQDPAQVVYNTFTNTLNASGNYPAGTTLVIWKVNKNGVQTTHCAMRVTVLDKEGPAITTCSADVIQELSGCGTPVPVAAPLAQDNCRDGWAMRFDKVDDEILVDRDLLTTNIFTYEFYVKPAALIDFDPEFSNQNYVIYPGNGNNVYGTGHAIVGVSVGTNGMRVMLNSNNNLIDILNYETPFPETEWTHISLVFDKTLPNAVCKFYLNGTFVHSAGFPTADVWHASLGFRPALAGGGIGGGTSGHFGGTIDELRVWNSKRTVSEMSADRRTEITGLEANLVAYYKFNEGSGSSVTHGSLGSYILNNMDPVSSWVSEDPIKDLALINNYNGSISAADIYPVGVTVVLWSVMDKFGNISICSNSVQVNNLSTVELICADQRIENTPDRCDAPVVINPPAVVASSCEGYALRFDGVNDYVSMNKDLGVTNTFTYEMWVRPAKSEVFNSWGLGAYAIYPGLPELYAVPTEPYGLTTHSSVGIVIGQNGIGIYEHSYEYLPIQTKWETTTLMKEWTHIAVSYENNIIRIYVNGELKISASRIIDGRTVHANLGIPGGGGGIGGGVYGGYTGEMDEVRVWNYARTAEQIIRDKDIELNGNESGLKAYYNFNEGSGSIVATSKFGTAELTSMDVINAWVQPDPIRDYSFTNSFNGPISGEHIFPVGDTVITWTLTDKYGVSTSCSSTITVVDVQLPVVTCPKPFVSYLPDGSINKDVVLEDLVAYDNCGIKSIINNFNGEATVNGTFPIGTTSIEFTITDSNGNETKCSGVTITIEPTRLSIPTGISPNGDGANDAWILPGLEYFTRADVKIYNRNGDMVFKADHYTNEGTVFRGESNTGLMSNSTLPNGTYFYHITTVPDNELKAFTGYLEISR